MSHSCIYQISKKPYESEDDKYLAKEDFYETFVGSVADYVSEIKNDSCKIFTSLVRAFPQEFIDCDLEKHSFCFKPGFKEAYFQNKYKAFRQLAEAITLSEFANDTLTAYKLALLLRDRYDIYLSWYDSYGGYVCLDDFVRDEPIGQTYYVGGALDYHT
jgi:hypothetical protein